LSVIGLFPNGAGGHLTPGHVGKLIARVLPGDWTAHTLRHRYATRAYRGSHDLRAVQRLLGHESVLSITAGMYPSAGALMGQGVFGQQQFYIVQVAASRAYCPNKIVIPPQRPQIFTGL
jgi:hypothetical protein